MAAERERGDHPEVTAATPKRPEQIGVRLSARLDKAAVGQHDVGRDKVVDGEPEAPGEVANSTTEGQSAHSSCRDESRGGRHAKGTGGVVHIAPFAASVHPDRARGGVDRRAPQATEVDHESVIPDTETASVVCSSADGERHVVLPCEVDAGDHIGDIGAPNESSRSPVDRSVVDGPGLVVAKVGRERESTPYSSCEFVEREIRGSRGCCCSHATRR